MEEIKRLVKKQDCVVNMIIEKDLDLKIRFLCEKFPGTEWSGVLFYTHRGSFEEEKLDIICKDMLLMDIGTSTETSFSMNADVASYITHENPELLLECQQGLIHSHNSMPTFFSGTDKKTLISEGSDVPTFVSLIVNNDGKYSGAVTKQVIVEEEITGTELYTFFGQEKKRSYKAKREVIEIQYYEAVIERLMYQFTAFESIQDRINTIMEEKERTWDYNIGQLDIDNTYKYKTLKEWKD